MIHKIKTTQKDLDALSGRKAGSSALNLDYHKLVVKKPWGYEYLLYENSLVAVWVLFLNYGHSTSMHCHPNKKTSLIVLSGEVETSSLNGAHSLAVSDGLLIDAKTFHSTKAVSEGGAIIMEIETPPNKNDLVRLEDRYGREQKGYEGIANISFETEGYEYCYFEPGTVSKQGKIKNSNVHFITHHKPDDLVNYLQKIDSGVLGIVEGVLYDTSGEVLAEPGDSMETRELKTHMSNGAQIKSRFVTLHLH